MGPRHTAGLGAALCLWAALTSPAGAASAARAPESFERWLPPVKLHPLEEQALGAVRGFARQQGLRFRLDRRLIRAARAAASLGLGAAPDAADTDALRALAHRWGWTDGQLAIVTVPAADAATLTTIVGDELRRHLSGQALNRVGVGVAATGAGERRRLVLLFSRRLVHLLPTPGLLTPGAPLRTSGRLPPSTAEPTAGLELVVQLPSGQTVRPPVERHQRRFSAELVPGPEPGVARVQWLIDRGRGPEVAALFPVVIGHAAPAPAPTPLVTDGSTPDDDPTTTLTGLILGAREAEGEALPMTSAVLAELARRHAQDMRDQRFFAHVSPTSGDLDRRLRSRGIGFVRAVENLALSDSAAGAFHQWMQSPAHRANLLDGQVNALGVGMVEGPAEAGVARWYAVAVLVRLADDGSDGQLRQQASAVLDARRRALRLPRLRRDETLDALASRHSRESALLGELTDVSPIRGRLIDTVLDETEATAAAADVFLAATVEAVGGAAHLGEPFTRVGVGVHRDRGRAGAQLWLTVLFARD